MTKTVSTSMEQYTDADIDQLASFGPAFDRDTMTKIEESEERLGNRRTRRAALLVLTKSAEELSTMSLDEAKTFAELSRAVDAFQQFAEGMFKAAQDAAMRMKIADVREPRTA